MVIKEYSTRQYGKLFNKLVGEFKAPVGDFDGTIKITRLKKYDDNSVRYHGGEVDIVFKGKIMANNGKWYSPFVFGKKNIRKFVRRNFEKNINSKTRVFGVDNIKICKITFER